MSDLNPQQAQAVLHRDGPLLVLAGAGTGKTRVVTERLARLLNSGVPPENLLAVTFTNKAAGEMRQRLARLVGRRFSADSIWLSTFHSLCVRLIRRDASVLGYRPGFAIHDRGEQLSLVRQASRHVSGAAKLSPEELLERLGRYKNAAIDPQTAIQDANEPGELTSAHVYRKYQAALLARNALDFDDLLGQAVRLLRSHPPALEYWRDRFRFIMVDEYQDANAIQNELLDLLAQPRRNLAVVGDDDQSIYGWRGAAARNILDFPLRYPGARVIALEENYRSVNRILQAANAVIANNASRHPKTLRSGLGEGDPIRVCVAPDQEEEAKWIAGVVAGDLAGGAAPASLAVLLRVNAQARRLEESFRDARVPYVLIGGQSYYERKEVRDLLAYFALVAHPADDNALRRVINVPPRGLGEKSLEAIEKAASAAAKPLSHFLARPGEAGLSGKAAEEARALAGQLDGWRAAVRGGRLRGLAERIGEDIGYAREVDGLYDDPLVAADRYRQALELDESLMAHVFREAAGGKEAASPPASPEAFARLPGQALRWLSEFTQEAALWGRSDGTTDAEVKRSAGAVRIITGHSAKGLEFDSVFIPGVEEGIWPHKHSEGGAAVEEERRLFYVALTRARRRLTLTHCAARMARGKREVRAPSRFLGEIPEAWLARETAHVSGQALEDFIERMAGSG